MQTHTTPAGVAGTPRAYTASEVFRICTEEVYPPCKKASVHIGLHDRIHDDLGYLGGALALLASRTNMTFEFEEELHLHTHDIEDLATVQDHLFAICKRLDHAGRLLEKE